MTTSLYQIALNAYGNFSAWDKSAASMIYKSTTEEELNQAVINAGSFDFQNGGSYYSGLSDLAYGEVYTADKDNDGQVSYEECLELKKKEYSGIIGDEMLNALIEQNYVEMEFWGKDCDVDGFVTPYDLELYYSIADESLPSEENQRVKDGKFTQEDLEQAGNIMLEMLANEHPELENELMQRRDYLDLLSFDLDGDGNVDKDEYMYVQQRVFNRTSAEDKAGAYCMFDLIDGTIGNGDGTLDEQELASYVQHQYEGGYEAQEYYNLLLEVNFTGEDAGNHGYYSEVLDA